VHEILDNSLVFKTHECVGVDFSGANPSYPSSVLSTGM